MPISGMTGFARTEGVAGAWSWSVEARSVNGRNLEARFRGPPGFEGLERLVREGAQARFQRGQIAVALQARRSEAAGGLRLNADVLQQVLALAAPYVESGRAAQPSFVELLSVRGVLDQGEENDPETAAATEQAMAASVSEALDRLATARREEGLALVPVLGGLVDRIAALVLQAEAEAAAQPAIVRDRFARRMAELVGDAAGLEDRIVQEAAALAARADVREELDRLKAHVEAARTLIEGQGPAGRRLDFLAQEFMREANTLCSKSATSALTAVGLDLKAVIEQLREQIQNVE